MQRDCVFKGIRTRRIRTRDTLSLTHPTVFPPCYPQLTTANPFFVSSMEMRLLRGPFCCGVWAGGRRSLWAFSRRWHVQDAASLRGEVGDGASRRGGGCGGVAGGSRFSHQGTEITCFWHQLQGRHAVSLLVFSPQMLKSKEACPCLAVGQRSF